MAYIDSNARRTSPASIASAVAINALLVGGVILAAPELIKEPPWNVLQTYGVAPPPPPEPIKTPQDPNKSKSSSPYTPPKPDAPQPDPTQKLIPQPGPAPTPGPGTGTALTPTPTPIPLPRNPVLTGVKINPRYANLLQPEYPPGMIREGREGLVIVRVLIGTDGRVKAIEPVSSDGDAFLAVTRKQALGKWRFLPATRDGEPIEAWREMTVRFRLPDTP